MPYHLAKDWAARLQAWGVGLEAAGQKSLPRLDRRWSVQAQVRWEQWTNGEGFKTIKLLAD
jgi:hypothetical protein